MNSNSRQPGLDVDRLAETGNSNPDLTTQYNVDVREFVILACICDLGPLDADQIARQVGLSPSTIRYCVDSLIENGLILRNGESPTAISTTNDGRALVRKSGHTGISR